MPASGMVFQMRPNLLLIGSAVALCATAVPLHAQKPRRAPPVLVPPAAPPASAGDSTRRKGTRPPPTLVTRPGAGAPSPAVAPQATRPPAAPVVAGFTAGLAIAPYEGDTDDDRARYLRRFTTQLDSATALLVAVFRNTSGQPMTGADAPTSLSARERERWGRCRDLHFDLVTYGEAMHELVDALPEEAPVQRAGRQLDSTLTSLRATVECDNVASMISAPDRWPSWGGQYTSSARTFYHDWYAQIRDVADRNRSLVMAVNGILPAASRIPVPPALPRTPPYAGAGPR